MPTVTGKMSVAVAVNEMGASGGIMVAGTGILITGGIVSPTVTNWVAVVIKPFPSVAVQVTVVLPSG